ncbi:MAG: MerR family transcriptional regulator [Xanthomonadaceae bacterium]|nr:MerR family transcriptional regulator [Xanthomonadaceae bacterium]
MKLLTVGEVSRRTGLTVRALHHYETLGLLRPAARSGAGYRLYGEVELRRLQYIVSLKALGLSLDAIGTTLDADSSSLAAALQQQVIRLRQMIAHQHALLARLEILAQRLAAGGVIDVDTLLSSIEASTLMENYLSNEQWNTIKKRGETLGADRIRAVERAWPEVIAGMQAAMQLGKDPTSDEVRPLAQKWRTLVREFTGGDVGIQRSLNTMFKQEADTMQKQTGIDPALMAYACQAIAALPAEVS